MIIAKLLLPLLLSKWWRPLVGQDPAFLVFDLIFVSFCHISVLLVDLTLRIWNLFECVRVWNTAHCSANDKLLLLFLIQISFNSSLNRVSVYRCYFLAVSDLTTAISRENKPWNGNKMDEEKLIESKTKTVNLDEGNHGNIKSNQNKENKTNQSKPHRHQINHQRFNRCYTETKPKNYLKNWCFYSSLKSNENNNNNERKANHQKMRTISVSHFVHAGHEYQMCTSISGTQIVSHNHNIYWEREREGARAEKGMKMKSFNFFSTVFSLYLTPFLSFDKIFWWNWNRNLVIWNSYINKTKWKMKKIKITERWIDGQKWK